MIDLICIFFFLQRCMYVFNIYYLNCKNISDNVFFKVIIIYVDRIKQDSEDDRFEQLKSKCQTLPYLMLITHCYLH